MMSNKIALIILLLEVALSSCNVLERAPKNEFTDGFYKERLFKKEKKYIDVQDETVCIYATTKQNNKLIIDTTKAGRFYKNEMNNSFQHSETFVNPSLDIDFLTIPFKYRFQQNSVPPQLNANLNGALYIGYRIDRYVMRYKTNPKLKTDRNLSHFGISFGLCSGLGSTFMSPTNTNNILQQEYDALVWNKGIATIFAINKFTLGLTLGFDNLLDKNNTVWIYESKPWIGLALGLNIN